MRASRMNEILNPNNYSFNVYTIGPVLVGLCVFALGIAVSIKERTSHASLAFLLFSFSVSFWLFSNAAITASLSESVALPWSKIKNIGVAFIPSMTFIFSLTVIRRFREFRDYALLSLFLSILFGLGIPLTDWFIEGVYHYSWGYYPKYAGSSFGLIIFFAAMVFFSMALFILEYRKTESEIHKRRMRRFLVAFAIGSFAGVDFLAAFGVPVYPIGYLPIFIFLLLTARTVLKFRLLDITPSFAALKIVNTMSDALVVFDHEGIIRFTNQAASELFQDKLMGKPIEAINGGLLKESQLQSVMQGRSLIGIESVYKNRFEQEIMLNISASAILDKAGNPAAVVCLVRDISEHKQLEKDQEQQAKQLEDTNQELLDREKVMLSLLEDLQASQQSNSQLASIVQFSDDPIFSKTLEGIIISWNRGAELIYGYSAKEVIGRSISIIIPPDRVHELRELMGKVSKGQRVHQFETERITKAGKRISVSITISPIRDASDNVIGASTVVRDITEQKKIQEQLRVSEEHSRAIIETAYDAFVGMNSDGFITDWNKQAEIIFGRTKLEVLGKLLADMIIPEQHRQAHQEGLKRFLAGGAGPVLNRRIQMSGLHKDGHEFPCELSIWPVQMGKTFLFNAFIHDITARKMAEETLLQNTAELGRLTAEREQAELFAFAASHDLQEPLAKIISFGDLLKMQSQDKLDVKCQDYIHRMQASANRMSQLIDSLLRFSRVTTKGETFGSVDLEKVIHEVLADLEHKISESKSSIQVEKLPVVKGDWHQLYEVFQNLISNSIKFRKKEGRHEIKISANLTSNGYTEISVADNGVGFEQKYAEKLFKPFERLHSRSEYEGSGMGLAICQKILLRHKGLIRAKGELGKGAVFVLRLPSETESKISS